MFFEKLLVFKRVESVGLSESGQEQLGPLELHFDNVAAPKVPQGMWELQKGAVLNINSFQARGLSKQEVITQIAEDLKISTDALDCKLNSESGFLVTLNRDVVIKLFHDQTFFGMVVSGVFIKRQDLSDLDFDITNLDDPNPLGLIRRSRLHWEMMAQKINSLTVDQAKVRHVEFIKEFEEIEKIQSSFKVIDEIEKREGVTSKTKIVRTYLRRLVALWQSSVIKSFPEYVDSIVALDKRIKPRMNLEIDDLIDIYTRFAMPELDFVTSIDWYKTLEDDDALSKRSNADLNKIVKEISTRQLRQSDSEIDMEFEVPKVGEDQSLFEVIDEVKVYLQKIGIKSDLATLSQQQSNQVVDTLLSSSSYVDRMCVAVVLLFPNISDAYKQLLFEKIASGVQSLPADILFRVLDKDFIGIENKHRLARAFGPKLNDFDLHCLQSQFPEFFEANKDCFEKNPKGYLSYFGREVLLDSMEEGPGKVNFVVHPFYSLEGTGVSSEADLQGYALKLFNTGKTLQAMEIMQEYQKLKSVVASGESLVFLLPRYSEEFGFLKPLLIDILGEYPFHVIESLTAGDGYIPYAYETVIQEKLADKQIVFSGGYIDKCLSGAVEGLSQLGISGVHDVSASSLHPYELPSETLSSNEQLETFSSLERFFECNLGLVRSLNEYNVGQIFDKSKSGSVEAYKSYVLMMLSDFRSEQQVVNKRVQKMDSGSLEYEVATIHSEILALQIEKLEREFDILGEESIVGCEMLVSTDNLLVLSEIEKQRARLFADADYNVFLEQFEATMHSYKKRLEVLESR